MRNIRFCNDCIYDTLLLRSKQVTLVNLLQFVICEYEDFTENI